MTLDVAWLLPWLDRFLWALARVSGLCLLAPVFGASVIPMRTSPLMAGTARFRALTRPKAASSMRLAAARPASTRSASLGWLGLT